MYGSVTAPQGAHVTGKYKNDSMMHTCDRHAAWVPNGYEHITLLDIQAVCMSHVCIMLSFLYFHCHVQAL